MKYRIGALILDGFNHDDLDKSHFSSLSSYLDEHFGDWVVLPLAIHPGVIRIKVNPTTANNISGILLPFLKKRVP